MPRKRRPWRWKVTPEGCWVCTSHKPNKHGLLNANVYRDGKWTGTTHPRLMFELRFGPVQPRVMVIHVCGNSLCMRPEHLKAQGKKCPGCGIWKRLDDENFYVEPQRPGGYSATCKECKRERNRRYWKETYYPAHREEQKAAVTRRRKDKAQGPE